MKKLYYPKENPKHYWEYWDNEDGTFTIHWGELGTEGEDDIIKRRFFSSAESKIQKLEREYSSKGYQEISLEDHKLLLIEFEVDGFGTEDDLLKRHSLEDLMNETLGWNGLGHCDGGSIGSGTMEVCCFVVDFDIAHRVIAGALQGTEFEDYSRIYLEQ